MTLLITKFNTVLNNLMCRNIFFLTSKVNTCCEHFKAPISFKKETPPNTESIWLPKKPQLNTFFANYPKDYCKFFVWYKQRWAFARLLELIKGHFDRYKNIMCIFVLKWNLYLKNSAPLLLLTSKIMIILEVWIFANDFYCVFFCKISFHRLK